MSAGWGRTPLTAACRQFLRVVCPGCGTHTRPELPAGVERGAFGPNAARHVRREAQRRLGRQHPQAGRRSARVPVGRDPGGGAICDRYAVYDFIEPWPALWNSAGHPGADKARGLLAHNEPGHPVTSRRPVRRADPLDPRNAPAERPIDTLLRTTYKNVAFRAFAAAIAMAGTLALTAAPSLAATTPGSTTAAATTSITSPAAGLLELPGMSTVPATPSLSRACIINGEPESCPSGEIQVRYLRSDGSSHVYVTVTQVSAAVGGAVSVGSVLLCATTVSGDVAGITGCALAAGGALAFIGTEIVPIGNFASEVWGYVTSFIGSLDTLGPSIEASSTSASSQRTTRRTSL